METSNDRTWPVHFRCHAPTVSVLLVQPARAEEPLCGIRAVYSGALLLGLKPSFADVLQPEFVGSEAGSSLVELENAAAKLGLESLSVRGLTTRDLQWSHFPMILHVKTDLSSSEFKHFVLFGGMEAGKARIYDGTDGIRHLTLAEVASRWDGNALILSTQPVRLGAFTSISYRQRVVWFVAMACVLGLALMVQRSWAHVPRSRLASCSRQVIALCVVSGCGAWVYHRTSPEGFIVGPEAVRGVRAANASRFLPKIDLKEVRALHRSGNAVFIDARNADDYSAGHIDGAVNFSAHMPDAQAARTAGSLSRDRRLVVYCANAECPYSVRVAQWLLEAGHEDVAIFSDGWKAWRTQSVDTLAGQQP